MVVRRRRRLLEISTYPYLGVGGVGLGYSVLGTISMASGQ